jgi:hypothetical protein
MIVQPPPVTVAAAAPAAPLQWLHRPPPRRLRPRASAPAPAAAPQRGTGSTLSAPGSSGRTSEVSLDQETFDKTLEELLAAGTDRRIAEGKAKRAAMIAARKKAAGEG